MLSNKAGHHVCLRGPATLGGSALSVVHSRTAQPCGYRLNANPQRRSDGSNIRAIGKQGNRARGCVGTGRLCGGCFANFGHDILQLTGRIAGVAVYNADRVPTKKLFAIQ
jgi:hypothetical protein